jgi:hypothetical protein
LFSGGSGNQVRVLAVGTPSPFKRPAPKETRRNRRPEPLKNQTCSKQKLGLNPLKLAFSLWFDVGRKVDKYLFKAHIGRIFG